MSIVKGDRVLLDTGIFIGLHNSRDEHRDDAIDLYEKIKDLGLRAVTSDYVLDEAVTFAVARTKQREVALGVGTMLLTTKNVSVHFTTDRLVRRAWLNFQRYDDKDLSFTDCLLLALCQEESVPILATFDSGFDGIHDGPIIVHTEAALIAQT